jgi:hypothetical protein
VVSLAEHGRLAIRTMVLGEFARGGLRAGDIRARELALVPRPPTVSEFHLPGLAQAISTLKPETRRCAVADSASSFRFWGSNSRFGPANLKLDNGRGAGTGGRWSWARGAVA